MGKLIDEQTAYDVLTDYYHHSTDTQHAALREALGRVETVDAVPVVHCRDCKYWKTGEGVNRSKKVKFCTYPIGHRYARRDEDFCSRGERKDGDHHD